MPRADELARGDRTRHPQLGHIITVNDVTHYTNRTIVYWQALGGERGSLTVAPHTEMEDCT